MIQTIEKLKSYFYEHAYPTWQQFHDLLDSFRHKNDKVPITDVDGLSDMLNGKAAISTVSELVQVVEDKEEAGVAASLVADEATARQQSDEVLQTNINAKANSSDVFTKTEINNKLASVYKYKTTVPDQASLPATGQIVGDVYNCADTGMNFAWNGTEWDALGTFSSGFVSYMAEQNLTVDQKIQALENAGAIPRKTSASINGNVCTCAWRIPDDLLFMTLDVYLNGVLQNGSEYDVDTSDLTQIKVTFKGTSPETILDSDSNVIFKFLGGIGVAVG
jgi:hypothetical protein